jgi:hypothetical protein
MFASKELTLPERCSTQLGLRYEINLSCKKLYNYKSMIVAGYLNIYFFDALKLLPLIEFLFIFSLFNAQFIKK